MAELADAPDLGSGAFGRGGSSPFSRTSLSNYEPLRLFLLRISMLYDTINKELKKGFGIAKARFVVN